MHHLGVGASSAHRRVLAIADQTTVTVIDLTTGEISAPTPSADRSYWRNQQNATADGQGVTNDPTHLSHDPTHHNGAPGGDWLHDIVSRCLGT
jgi:hypothetical protein